MEYSPSWIDDEGLNKSAFVFLRDLVVVYQTKKELLSFFTLTPGFIDHSGLDGLTKLEIKNWILRTAVIELSEDNKKLKQHLWNAQHPPVVVEPVKDEDRFELFLMELKALLFKHQVSMGADYDGDMYVEDDKSETVEAVSVYLANNIMKKEV